MAALALLAFLLRQWGKPFRHAGQEEKRLAAEAMMLLRTYKELTQKLAATDAQNEMWVAYRYNLRNVSLL